MPKFAWTPESVVELNATSSVHPIHGDIHDIRGEAVVDVEDGQIVPGAGTSGWIEASVDALKSGKKLEDIALPKQIDAKNYPTVRYEVNSVEGGAGSYKVTGAFTFHGVTQEFVEQANARVENNTLYVDAEHTFDITDFGVKPFKILSLKIDPEVRLVLHLVGR
jgi:polyisoprenoid-binding protein YceI